MYPSDYLRTWLAGKCPDLRRSTYEAYTVYLERQIIPWFEALGKSMQQLRPWDIRAYVMEKRVKGRKDGKPGGLSAVTVRKRLSIIKQAFRDAVLYGILETSPAEPVKLPRLPEPARHAPEVTAEDATRILQAVSDTPLYPAVLIALYYGLRRSEVLGLKWSAVDMEKNTLQIRHTVVKNLTIQAGDQTKSPSSRRTFPLIPEVAAALQDMPGSSEPKRDGYLFARIDGTPWRPDCLTRSFQRALQRAGLSPLRFHDLRHATATILFERGWSVADVQHWLGHADIDTTMNIYVAYSRTRPMRLGGTLEGLFTLAPGEKCSR